ncbi:ATP-binding cassette domain-containing protein [Mycoplasmatota bacterium]|nr:ATP-binding cassette domain-containing protein [Mycoplasmatota bacterium]
MKLEINKVTHIYDKTVLKDISLSLDGYHSIAFIGVSGSGKSTLIRLLSGLEKATSGEVSINQYDVSSDIYKRKIGFVFQSHNLFPHLTLKKNITLVLEKTRKVNEEKASQIADKYLDLLHLSDQHYKLPRNVSGGQAQRASIARALAMNPDIVFLDEPTSSLDPILTDEVLTAIEELKGLGKDFIFVTHVISFVKDFADYVVFLDDGHIIEHGEPDILENPKTKQLEAFMKKVR